jgi:hypothetical protein
MRFLLTSCLLVLSLVSAQPSQAAFRNDVRFLDTWSEFNTWDLGTRPVDFAQSLDKKLVFVLDQNGIVHLYSAVGEQLGTIKTGSFPVAFAIEPRGKILHLVNQKGSYISIGISLQGGMLQGSILKTWQTAARPLDIAVVHERKLVFVLEADSAVHVYSFTGQPVGRIAVSPDTVALQLVPYTRKLYLVTRNGMFTRTESPY